MGEKQRLAEALSEAQASATSLARAHSGALEELAIIAVGAVLEGVAAGYEQAPSEARFAPGEIAEHLREVAERVPEELAAALRRGGE